MFKWEITFAKGIKEKTFTRFAETEAEAILDAQHGFQAAYGYWPSDVVLVVQTIKPPS